jgi:hypothetical protein
MTNARGRMCVIYDIVEREYAYNKLSSIIKNGKCTDSIT